MSSSNITWDTKLIDFLNGKQAKSCENLEAAGYNLLKDLLWLIPIRFHKIPKLDNFKTIKHDEPFKGAGKVLSFQGKPNFKNRGKGKVQLQNITLHVKDIYSNEITELKWFNAYPSMVSSLKKLDHVVFSGIPQVFMGKMQFINPELEEYDEQKVDEEYKSEVGQEKYKIQYPTTNGVSSVQIKKIMDKIPSRLWNEFVDDLPEKILEKNSYMHLHEAFKIIHGQTPYDKQLFEAARNRLIYEEFFIEQTRILGRKMFLKKQSGIKINVSAPIREEANGLFSYELTPDQKKSLQDIYLDIQSGSPMMRLIQGDVGCGKTSVACATAFSVIKNGHQVAFMCPTESLATQHFKTLQEILPKNISTGLLLGSTSKKEKKEILQNLESGKIDLIIGTHSLIQDSVIFKSLGLAIIDEQHKFGVNQRLKLVKNNPGAHCLIMTATPIPRSLSLTQYGDLTISTIKSMPGGRKGTKTRLVTPSNFEKFLSFIKTRLSLDEQIYIVVPAITESETQDILHLEKVLERFKKIFPEIIIEGLHGQMDSESKKDVFERFGANKIKILIATSVVEVGINVLNATVMAVLNPERFGLSSLHQLRGRVGRGEKPGFFFLVSDKKLSSTSLERMKILEESTDGFKISEEDLKIRGEGDLFGTDQSGTENTKKLANIIIHQHHLINARNDVLDLFEEKNPYLMSILESHKKDSRITKTI